MCHALIWAACASDPDTLKLNPAPGNFGSASLTIAGDFTTARGIERSVAASTGTATVTLQGGTLALAAPVPALTIGDVHITLGTGGGVIDTGGFDATLGAALSGASLTKSGAGVLVLTGDCTHTGATTVAGGMLRVDAPGALSGGGAVHVDASAVFGGDGRVSRAHARPRIYPRKIFPRLR